MALFVERASAIKPDFALSVDNAAAVAQICTRLDGLPLAIELAAARVRLLPPQAMLSRLDHRLALLTGGPQDLPARQQTLRTAIAWSYDLLEKGEQTLFGRMGVFVGGCLLKDAETICDASETLPVHVLNGVEELMSKNLLLWSDLVEGEPRVRMLETILEYALEQLQASGEADRIRDRHANHYLALAEPPPCGSMAPNRWPGSIGSSVSTTICAPRWSGRVASGNMKAFFG